MRTKLNLDGSSRRVAERLGISGMSGLPPVVRPAVPTPLPMEWLDAANWRLPSGKALAEFALQAGFLAPLLFKAGRFGSAQQFPGEASQEKLAMPSRVKHFWKGLNR